MHSALRLWRPLAGLGPSQGELCPRNPETTSPWCPSPCVSSCSEQEAPGSLGCTIGTLGGPGPFPGAGYCAQLHTWGLVGWGRLRARFAPSGFHRRFKDQNGTSRQWEEEVPLPPPHRFSYGPQHQSRKQTPQMRSPSMTQTPPESPVNAHILTGSSPSSADPSSAKGAFMGGGHIVNIHSENKVSADLRTCPECVPWREGPGRAGAAD